MTSAAGSDGPTAFDALLEVQDRDTTCDQLRYRRQHLPQRGDLAALEGRLAELEARLSEVAARRDAVAERQCRLEAEVRALDERIAELNRRLYSGTVSAARELQAMAAEVESMKARRSSLEDDVLVAMEEGEPVAAEAAALEAGRTSLDAEAGVLRAAVAEAEVAIDAEIHREQEARAATARAVPVDLLATYERLRAKLGGVGAARLEGSTCSGCHLALPASELARVRREPPDALILCDQCGRILVR